MPDGAPGAGSGATPSPAPTVRRALTTAIGRLRAAGIDGAPLDAELLLADAMDRARGRLLTDDAELLAGAAAERFERHLARRLAREPVSRILGWREFWSLELEISPAVLDPRPDSETLVEAALAVARGRTGNVTIADLGTGSGCLLLALLSELDGAFGVGVDRDPAALDVARRNALRSGLGERAAFVAADWGAALGGRFDIVLCNPPYLAAPELATAAAELGHDPHLALAGGEDGLDSYRALMPGLPSCLAEDGWAFLEIGAAQAPAVRAIVTGAGLEVEAVVADLAGSDRCIVTRAGGNPAGRQKNGWIGKPSGLGCQHLDAVGGRVSQGILPARRFGA